VAGYGSIVGFGWRAEQSGGAGLSVGVERRVGWAELSCW
jgi:hypothetical protein